MYVAQNFRIINMDINYSLGIFCQTVKFFNVGKEHDGELVKQVSSVSGHVN